MITVVCHNERSKLFSHAEKHLVSICGKYLLQVESLDKNLTVISYCRGCHKFIKIDVRNGEIFLSNVDKEKMNFSKRARCTIKNYSIQVG